MRFIIILFLPFIFLPYAEGQDIEIINFEDLAPRLAKANDTVYVVNFWATWCKPCTEEMPDLIKLAGEMENSKFKLLLVSLDMPSQLDSRVLPFVEKLKITSEVVLLDDPDSNSWIDRVDPDWSGSIPATLVFIDGYRKFVEGKVTYNELKGIVTPRVK